MRVIHNTIDVSGGNPAVLRAGLNAIEIIAAPAVLDYGIRHLNGVGRSMGEGLYNTFHRQDPLGPMIYHR